MDMARQNYHDKNDIVNVRERSQGRVQERLGILHLSKGFFFS
jgi:hypothetical protein